ncbi:MAG: Crp/Fnr family transcriptional regulator [Gammaproteobacteria bacterium]|nr:Crp/Fnr family transcriptional regulator [Gammaproteobacteria bacterium]
MAHDASKFQAVVTTLNSDITQFLQRYGVKRVIQSDSTFISEGEFSKTLFVILDGDVNIFKRDEQDVESLVATVGKGSILGEMGVFMEERRTSSAKAVTDVIALEFTADSFTAAIKNIPELSVRIIKSLSQKVLQSNSIIIDLNRSLIHLAISNEVLSQRDKDDEWQFTLDMNSIVESMGFNQKKIKEALNTMNNIGVISQLSRRAAEYTGRCHFPQLMKFIEDSASLK